MAAELACLQQLQFFSMTQISHCLDAKTAAALLQALALLGMWIMSMLGWLYSTCALLTLHIHRLAVIQQFWLLFGQHLLLTACLQ